jgi:hypothetical protein
LVSGGKEHVALDAVLFTLLTARNLIQRVEDVEADMTLSAYRDVMEDFISYSSACICEYIRRFDLATKNNVILLSRSNKAALVNGEIFREWLNEGGCVETILGTILSDTPITTKNLINESRDKLLDKWNSYCHLAKMSAISEEHVRFRLFITNEFLRSLDSLTDDEVEYSKKNVSYLETASKLAAELIDDGKHIYSLEPYCLALKLMAKCRFFYTSAYCILKDIHEAGEVNPDIDVREAALMAVINYLGDYLFEQMSIEDGQI